MTFLLVFVLVFPAVFPWYKFGLNPLLRSMLIILSHSRTLSRLGEEQLERITSVFEPEEAEE